MTTTNSPITPKTPTTPTTPNSGRKKKKKPSKTERKRRKRARELLQQQQTQTKDENSKETSYSLKVPASPLSIQDVDKVQKSNGFTTNKEDIKRVKHDLHKIHNNANFNGNVIDDNDDSKRKTHSDPNSSQNTNQNETHNNTYENISYKLEFVYPKNFKPTEGYKKNRTSSSTTPYIPYVHTNLRNQKKTKKDSKEIEEEDPERKDEKSNDVVIDDDIDDILFPQRQKKRMKEEAKQQKLQQKLQQKQIIKKKKEQEKEEKKKVDHSVQESKQTKQSNVEANILSPESEKNTVLSSSTYDGDKVMNVKLSDSNVNDKPTRKIEDEVTPNVENKFAKRKRSMSEDSNHQDSVKSQVSGISVEMALKDKFGSRPRSNSTDGELNLPRRGLCDEQQVMAFHRWDLKTFTPSFPRGFLNLGNTCFLNATLQCLAHLPTFCQCVAMLDPTKNKVVKKNGQRKRHSNGQLITMALRQLIRNVHGLEGNTAPKQNPISPKAIVQGLSLIDGTNRGYKFRPGRQEDAHEFLVHLLDAMNDGELKAAGINQKKSGWRDNLPIPRLDETTFVHRMFGGYLRSQVRCTSCKYKSNTYDPFLDLSLEVSSKKVNCVYTAFKEFTRKETLDAANKWKCSGCKKRVCPTKQLTCFRPPLSLCIQLKRFSFGGSMGGYMHHQFGFSHFAGKGMGLIRGGNKIQKSIEFPLTLKLPLSDGRKCEYELTGIVIHVGHSATSGHYTAFVRRPTSKGSEWYNMDDSFVEPVSEKTVLRQKDAYVLFYCRKEVKLNLPTPPSTYASAEDAKRGEDIKRRKRTEESSLGGDERKSHSSSVTSTNGITKSNDIAPTNKDVTLKSEKEMKDIKVNTEKEKKDLTVDSQKEKKDIIINSEKEKKDVNVNSEKEKKDALPDAVITDDKDDIDYSETKRKKGCKSLTLNQGSKHGSVQVVVGKLKKNKVAWRPNQSRDVSGSSNSTNNTLLQNGLISKWDDEDGFVVPTKDVSLRESYFKEIKQKEKSWKRKMYLDHWDSGLDAGRTKKVKEKSYHEPLKQLDAKDNKFQRLQHSLLQMNKGKAKGHKTSMKKRSSKK